MQEQKVKRSPFAPAENEVPVGWCSSCGMPILKGEKHLTISDGSAILWKEEMTASIVLHFCNKPPYFCTTRMLEIWPNEGIAGAVKRQKEL